MQCRWEKRRAHAAAKHAEAEHRKLKQTIETETAQLQDNIQTEATTVETEPAQVQSNIQTKATIGDLAGGTRKSTQPPAPSTKYSKDDRVLC